MSLLQPEQQQQAGPEAVPEASAWESSGSIGPFFGVISVLTILAVLSCYLGRKWNPRPLTPLESIENDSRSCFWWLKIFCRRPCMPSTTVQVKDVNRSPEILDKQSGGDCKDEEGEVVATHQNLHHQV